MSARASDYHLAKPTNDIGYLAPQFARAVLSAIAECNSVFNKLDAMVFETYRSNELQQAYYRKGRDLPPPPAKTVTNAPNNLYSWHGYGLAVDVIHRKKGWDAGDAWFAKVAEIFRKHGCDWGGHWTKPDPPHFQWSKCKPSPSDVARKLLRSRGVEAVWDAVGANTQDQYLTPSSGTDNMVVISAAPDGVPAAKAKLSALLADAGAKTLAIVHGSDAKGDQLARTLDARTQGFAWRRCAWVKDTGIIDSTDMTSWFGDTADVRGTVLSSVKNGRRPMEKLRFDATPGEADDALLAADAVRD